MKKEFEKFVNERESRRREEQSGKTTREQETGGAQQGTRFGREGRRDRGGLQ
jgi:hypothetical protein